MIKKTTPTAYRNNNNNIIDSVTREVRDKAPYMTTLTGVVRVYIT